MLQSHKNRLGYRQPSGLVAPLAMGTGLLEPARPGQLIRSLRLSEPRQEWGLGQPQQREEGK